jgi:hypothetical protein
VSLRNPVTRFAVAVSFVATGLCLAWSDATATGILDRFVTHLLERPAGPLSLRFLLQPTMAAIAAWKDGRSDAATGRSPYFWTVLSQPEKRRARLREGLHATGKILAMGLLLDIVYQLISYQRVYPLEAVAMALLLAFVPYLLLRGPIARIAARRNARAHAPGA